MAYGVPTTTLASCVKRSIHSRRMGIVLTHSLNNSILACEAARLRVLHDLRKTNVDVVRHEVQQDA